MSRRAFLSQLSQSQSRRYAGYSSIDGGLSEQLKHCYEDVAKKCIRLCEDLAVSHEGTVPDDVKERMSKVMKNAISQESVLEKLSQVAEELGEEEVDLSEVDGATNLRKLEKELDAVAEGTRKKLEEVLEQSDFTAGMENHPNWMKFLEVVNKGAEASQGNDSQGFEELEEEEAMELSDQEGGRPATQRDIIPNLDPISKKTLTDPIKNKVCGHIYGKAAIYELMKGSNVKCPTMGCSNRRNITKKDLVEDKELTRIVKKRLAAAKKQAANDSD